MWTCTHKDFGQLQPQTDLLHHAGHSWKTATEAFLLSHVGLLSRSFPATSTCCSFPRAIQLFPVPGPVPGHPLRWPSWSHQPRGLWVGSEGCGRGGAERCLLPAGPWGAPDTDRHAAFLPGRNWIPPASHQLCARGCMQEAPVMGVGTCPGGILNSHWAPTPGCYTARSHPTAWSP